MRKYEPLTTKLTHMGTPIVAMIFAEVEEAIAASLPQSAHNYDVWWDNDAPGRRNGRQCYGWKDAGYVVRDVDRARQHVVFERSLLGVR